MTDFSLIIPIYNEGKTLKKLLDELKKLDNNIEIILIDDGSTDTTNLILENVNEYKIITNKANKGKGFSIILGAEHASSENLILMDGDLEIDMEFINRHLSKEKSPQKR